MIGIYVTEVNLGHQTEKQDFKTFLSYLSTSPILYIVNVVFFLCVKRIVDSGIHFYFVMTNNQNFSNLLIKDIEKEISITFEMITLSIETVKTTVRPSSTTTPINDSPVDISERFTNHLQQQVLFFEEELRNKYNCIKSLLA